MCRLHPAPHCQSISTTPTAIRRSSCPPPPTSPQIRNDDFCDEQWNAFSGDRPSRDAKYLPSGELLYVAYRAGRVSEPALDVYVTAPGVDLAKSKPVLVNVAFGAVTSYLTITRRNLPDPHDASEHSGYSPHRFRSLGILLRPNTVQHRTGQHHARDVRPDGHRRHAARHLIAKKTPSLFSRPGAFLSCRVLVAVVLCLVRTLGRNTQVLGLLRSECRKLHANLFQVQPSHFFIQLLRQNIDVRSCTCPCSSKDPAQPASGWRSCCSSQSSGARSRSPGSPVCLPPARRCSVHRELYLSTCGLIVTLLTPFSVFRRSIWISLSKCPMLQMIAWSFIFFMCSSVIMSTLPVQVT